MSIATSPIRDRESRGTDPAFSLYFRSSERVTSTPSGWSWPLVEGDRRDLADADAALADRDPLADAGGVHVADLDEDVVAEERRRLAEPDEHHRQDEARHDDEHADPKLHDAFVHDHPRWAGGPRAGLSVATGRAASAGRGRRADVLVNPGSFRADRPARGAVRRPRRGRTGGRGGRGSLRARRGGRRRGSAARRARAARAGRA